MKPLRGKIKYYLKKAFNGYYSDFSTSLYKPGDTASRNINSTLGFKELQKKNLAAVRISLNMADLHEVFSPS